LAVTITGNRNSSLKTEWVSSDSPVAAPITFTMIINHAGLKIGQNAPRLNKCTTSTSSCTNTFDREIRAIIPLKLKRYRNHRLAKSQEIHNFFLRKLDVALFQATELR
jgi:hypothetical protein